MKKSNIEVESIKKKIIPILRDNKVSKAGIFGSFGRGYQKKRSDVDILVEIPDNRSLFSQAHEVSPYSLKTPKNKAKMSFFYNSRSLTKGYNWFIIVDELIPSRGFRRDFILLWTAKKFILQKKDLKN